MSQLAWVRSHVERCLQDNWEMCRVDPDGDGDYAYRWGTAACFVRLDPGDPIVVRVWAVAVSDVRPTAKVLRELNDVNARTRTAHAVLSGDRVIVEQALAAEGVDRETLDQACTSVGQVADDIGVMIATVCGGETPFEEDAETVDEEAS